MTKASHNPRLKSDKERPVSKESQISIIHSHSVLELSDSLRSGDRKLGKKSKLRGVASASSDSSGSGVKIKCRKNDQEAEIVSSSASSLSLSQKKPSKNSVQPFGETCLSGAPLHGLKAEKENACFTFATRDKPLRPLRFQVITTKALERQRKKKASFEVAVSSPFWVDYIRSNPNLLASTLSEEEGIKKADSSLPTFSQPITSDFPDVVRSYRCGFLPGFAGLRYSLRSRGHFQYWNASLNEQHRATKGIRPNRNSCLLGPLSTQSSFSFRSAPPTLPDSRKRGRRLRPLRATENGYILRRSTGVDFPSLLPDKNALHIPESASHSGKDDSSERFLGNYRHSVPSIRSDMDSKSSQQQITANQKNASPLIQNRPRPRVCTNFSSSFALPYGLGNRVQTSPVTAPTAADQSSYSSGPLESLQLVSENRQRTAARQQSQCNGGQRQQRKYLERQKLKLLKPLSLCKNQSNIAKLYDISATEFTASILPDPGTTSYRLTHDVSFDEGSRYRTADFPHGLKGNGDPRGQLGSMNTLSHHFAATASKRNSESVAASSQPRHEGRIGAGRDHGSQSKHSFKDSFSLLRMEDRCDLPPTTSPPSSAIPSAIAAPPSTSSFMPPPSASQRSNATNATSGGGNITFRLNKGKQNWNYKLGNLSINGGGYPNQSPLVPNPKQEVDSINPMNLISAVQRNLQTRERAVATGAKSRSAMRYGNKTDSANAPNYADPCIAAAPSFQQRLTDLSILESETIKYERNRKSRRKKNQDKDS